MTDGGITRRDSIKYLAASTAAAAGSCSFERRPISMSDPILHVEGLGPQGIGRSSSGSADPSRHGATISPTHSPVNPT